MSLKESGYYLARNLFPQERVEEVRLEICALFGEYLGRHDSLEAMAGRLFSEDFEGFLGCCKAAQNLLDLHRLFVGGEVAGALRSLELGMPNINTAPLLHFSSRFVAKEDYHWKVAAHQDWPSNQGSLNGLTAWMPLVELTDELGRLEVVPGSHLHGVLPHEMRGVPVLVDQYEGWTPVPMQIGDVLFFSAFLLHRSGSNVTDKIRLSAACRYNDLVEPTYKDRKFPRTPPLSERKCGSWPGEQDVRSVYDRSP